jgi:hypothetical protein
MSSESLAEGEGFVLAAWETEGQVYYARIDSKTRKPSPPIPAPGRGGGRPFASTDRHGQDRKHPSVATNARGEVILVWTEGTGWQKGGALAWQVFDAKGHPTAERGRVEGGIPVWGLATVVARPDGRFTIVH